MRGFIHPWIQILNGILVCGRIVGGGVCSEEVCNYGYICESHIVPWISAVTALTNPTNHDKWKALNK